MNDANKGDQGAAIARSPERKPSGRPSATSAFSGMGDRRRRIIGPWLPVG